MDSESDAKARLESEYLSGAISADEYMRRRRRLHEGLSETESAAPAPVAEVRYASWGRRAAAFLLDGLLAIAAFIAIGLLALATADVEGLETVWGLQILLVPSAYHWLTVGAWGQTLGKMAVGVRVVRSEDAGRLGYPRALGRVGSIWALGFLVLPLLLAYLWPLWDGRNQTIYDKFVNSVVVRLG